MPSSISTVGQLVAVIQAQLSSRVAVKPAESRTGAYKPAGGPSTYSRENLESLIGQRIKSIDRDDPNRGRKAFRVFLESILLSYFGEHLINDPRFYQLVDDVQMSMEADAEVRSMVDSAIRHLLSASS